MMKILAMVFASFLILFSCEKENEKQIIVENIDIPLISKIMVNGVSCYEYTYNNANLPVEEKSKFHYIKHSYSDNNLLLSSDFYMDPGMFSSSSIVVEASMNRKEWVNPDNTAKSLTKAFEYYDKDQSIKVTYNRPSVNNSEYSIFTIENERIIRQDLYWQNEFSFYFEYLYDDKGNLSKESKFYVPLTGIAELWTTTDYEYDTKHNPFQVFKKLVSPGKFTNPNNITKETYTVYFEVNQWTQRVSVINNSYVYNDKDYPVIVNGEAEYIYK